ncbi:MAG: haloacid dehalogenase-like hydrolase [Clostridiales bacterium]|nr:haloacid dehalogenase-like hydrolase [Clostridiales bacterium]
MKVVTVDHTMLSCLCARLENAARDYNPDVILSIASGGTYVGNLMFASLPHVEVSLHRESTAMKQRSGMGISIMKRMPLWVCDAMRVVESVILSLKKRRPRDFVLSPQLVSLLSRYHRILVVDDAVDSGVTLKAVTDSLSRLPDPPIVRTAVITVTTRNPLISPDYRLMTGVLLRFPWSLDFHEAPRVDNATTIPWGIRMPRGGSDDGDSRPLVVVDLDGTLVNCNTLHVYIISGLRRLVVQSPVKALKLTAIVALRSVRLVTHRTMKRMAMTLIDPDTYVRGMFVRTVGSKMNERVREMLDGMEAKGYITLLATAALDVYIPWIWEGGYVATSTSGNPQCHECRGIIKATAVADIASRCNLDLDTVITDHHDDLPLMEACARNIILVNPSAHTVEKLTMAGVNYKIL